LYRLFAKVSHSATRNRDRHERDMGKAYPEGYDVGGDAGMEADTKYRVT